MTKIAIGVDVGGSHVCCAACNLIEKKYLPETFSESDLDNQGTVNEIISTWCKTIKQTVDTVGLENLAGIGFAMPGPFDYENGISLLKGKTKKYDNTYGLNVTQAIRKHLGLADKFPIRFINDATAFAVGEDWIGKSKGSSRSLAITLGTGFGSAFLKDSLPVVADVNVPEMGYFWHLPFENKTADDYFSTRGLISRYYMKTGKSVEGVREVSEAAKTDKDAQALFNDFGQKLVEFLKPWFIRFDVEVLIIGGNISKAFELFWPAMQQVLNKEELNIKVQISELKETAAIIGSARLFEESFWLSVKTLLKDM